MGERDGIARPEIDVLKSTTILPQCDLVFGAAVDIIEDYLR
jgi:hypothetical protein